ncbi:PTS sugar transporter subunit IIA [Actinokineospora sp. HUAS TT18]|uniref:PTS sugar transporter subunit IIA n=1 Tax=Actinokineospora sp. HUAS TT18 TaxID=3447451 RepID=UPI003F51E544
MPLITEDLVLLDLETTDRAEATRALAARLADAGRVTDVEVFLADVAAREAQMATGLEGGIGLPHARSAAVAEPSLAFARSADGIEWGAPDGPAHLVFLIAAPDGAGGEHMKILAALARRLVHQSFKDALATAADPAAVVKLITEEVIDR